MCIKRIFSLAILFSCLLVTHFTMGINGITSPNSTGGFGRSNNTSTQQTLVNPNPSGGFGTSTTLGLAPPPPPPVPVPLDGGISLLIAATLGIGIKKLFGEVKNK